MANTSYNSVTVTTSATLIIAANPKRKGLIIANTDADTIYVGPDASITTANAIPILASATLMNSGQPDAWRGDVYGIVGSGTADVRYWQWGA